MKSTIVEFIDGLKDARFIDDILDYLYNNLQCIDELVDTDFYNLYFNDYCCYINVDDIELYLLPKEGEQGLYRLLNFLGGVKYYGDNWFYFDGYGNLSNVDYNAVIDLKNDVLDALQNALNAE